MRDRRANTPPPVMDRDSDDDHPIGDDDIEIIDDAELDGSDYVIDDDDENDGYESNGQNEPVEAGVPTVSPPSQWIDDAKLKFKKHTSDVFCCAVNKHDSIVVSGAQDDKAYIWDLNTAEVLFESVGHQDSVTHVGFNHDSSLVATADMKGIIMVWKVQEKEKVWEFEISDLRWLAWHQATNILFAGSMDGEAWMWLVPSGVAKTFPSFGSPISCGRLLADGKRMVLGYEDGTIRIWDLKAVAVLHAITGVNAHTANVICIDCSTDSSLILSGSEDGAMKLLNVQTGKVINSFILDYSPIESLTFSPRSSLVASGSADGVVAILDLSTQVIRHSIKDMGYIVKIVWHPTVEKFFVGSLEGNVTLVDARSGQIEKSWKGHRNDLLDIVVTSDGCKIITASEDYECRVFDNST